MLSFGSTVNATVRVGSSGVSITNCVLTYLSITTSNSASATVKNCIFPDSSYAIYNPGSCTLKGWNIFAKDPGTTTGHKHAIHVTNGGKIKNLKIGDMETAMNDITDLYVVGDLPNDLKLTLDDGTVRTVLKSEIANGASTDLPKHIPLTITEEGKPKVDGMDSAAGYFCVTIGHMIPARPLRIAFRFTCFPISPALLALIPSNSKSTMRVLLRMVFH